MVIGDAVAPVAIAVVARATSGALDSRSISTTASTMATAHGCAARRVKQAADIGVTDMNSAAMNDPFSECSPTLYRRSETSSAQLSHLEPFP